MLSRNDITYHDLEKYAFFFFVESDSFSGYFLVYPPIPTLSRDFFVYHLFLAPLLFALHLPQSTRLYAPQMENQARQIHNLQRDENVLIPDDVDFLSLGSHLLLSSCAHLAGFLSNEERQKLHKHRPQTLGQAGRIQGKSTNILLS